MNTAWISTETDRRAHQFLSNLRHRIEHQKALELLEQRKQELVREFMTQHHICQHDEIIYLSAIRAGQRALVCGKSPIEALAVAESCLLGTRELTA